MDCQGFKPKGMEKKRSIGTGLNDRFLQIIFLSF